MSKLKLTPWFTPEIKPVHPGVYETELRGRSFDQHIEFGYSYWTGLFWGNNQPTPMDALRARERGAQDKPWRGLAEKPE